jgi:hypothetical protein
MVDDIPATQVAPLIVRIVEREVACRTVAGVIHRGSLTVVKT